MLSKLTAADAVNATLADGRVPSLDPCCLVADLQTRMIQMLNVMHDQNASFGPLFLSQPGNISAHFDYKELMDHAS